MFRLHRPPRCRSVDRIWDTSTRRRRRPRRRAHTHAARPHTHTRRSRPWGAGGHSGHVGVVALSGVCSNEECCGVCLNKSAVVLNSICLNEKCRGVERCLIEWRVLWCLLEARDGEWMLWRLVVFIGWEDFVVFVVKISNNDFTIKETEKYNHRRYPHQ